MRETTSRLSGHGAKIGAYIGCGAYLVTHFIPMSGYKHVLDWMHSSAMSALSVTSNKIAGSPENLTGMVIYVLGWGVFAALGAAIGAVFGGRPAIEAAPPARSVESAASTNLPLPERDARTAAVVNADDEVAANTTSRSVETDIPAPVETAKPPRDESAEEGSKQTVLPWAFVAAAAAGTFLAFNWEKVRGRGGFIYLIGAVVLGILSANMLSKK